MVSAAGSFESPREYLKHDRKSAAVVRQCDVRQTGGSQWCLYRS